MWSPNEISKQEKQRDIFAYITLPFFQVKKGSLSTFRFWNGIFPLHSKKLRFAKRSFFIMVMNYFRTTSPPRPVCAVMYSRPILEYSNGFALAGSCSASTMIHPS